MQGVHERQIERCPTCGSEVRVVSSDEGTSYYEPVPSEQLEQAERTLWNIYLASGADPSGFATETRTPEGREAGFQEWRKQKGRYDEVQCAVEDLRADYD